MNSSFFSRRLLLPQTEESRQPALFDDLQGWLDDPVHVSLGLDEPVPPGLQHRYMVVPAERKLAALCRQIRVDLKQ